MVNLCKSFVNAKFVRCDSTSCWRNCSFCTSKCSHLKDKCHYTNRKSKWKCAKNGLKMHRVNRKIVRAQLTWAYHFRACWEYRPERMAWRTLCFVRPLSCTANSSAVHVRSHIDHPHTAGQWTCNSTQQQQKIEKEETTRLLINHSIQLNLVKQLYSVHTLMGFGLGGPTVSHIRSSSSLHFFLYCNTFDWSFATRAAWFCCACLYVSKRRR